MLSAESAPPSFSRAKYLAKLLKYTSTSIWSKVLQVSIIVCVLQQVQKNFVSKVYEKYLVSIPKELGYYIRNVLGISIYTKSTWLVHTKSTW